MAIKSYAEFVNENLIGQYSYYGQGSLFPIAAKLASEGKSAEQIYLYLTTLGIDEERKRKVISQLFLNESIDFDAIMEKGGLYEDDLDDIAKASTSDLKKGIDPSKASPDSDVQAALDKLKDGDEDDMKDKFGEIKEKFDEKIETVKLNLRGGEFDATGLNGIRFKMCSYK